ncbi:IMP dehydrogenase [Candidatus Saccharibacteria bacterium]|jgi:IMP dehydrogenase|nr:IMP dehydrogenase [Candidatus Saccharibacteria bacterium]
MVDKNISLGLTFDDVLLIPGASSVLPSNVKVGGQFSTGIGLNTPIVSAAMDTVTEAATAIALARAGGIGVLHRSLTPEAQAAEVTKVKRAQSSIIRDPVTASKDMTVAQANRLGVTGIPILDGDKLLGIVTNRDLRYIKDDHKTLGEIMTTDVVTVTEDIEDDDAVDLMHEHKIEKLPVVDANNKLLGLITFKDIDQRSKFPNANKDERGQLRVAAAVGTDAGVNDRIDALVKAGIDAIIVDTAHGHSSKVIDTVKTVRANYPELQIVAGNIATAGAAQALIDAGVNALKVGIGPGSICTTRIVAGIGVPQLTAIQNVASVARDQNIPVIADGGIKQSGDIVKALAAGASCVMLGGLLAGTDETPGERTLYQGRAYKTYRGMGSIGAMQKGSRDRYFQDNLDEFELEQKLVPEGIEGRVPYKGPIAATIFQLIGGLRAGMGYVGAADLDELYEKAQFIQVTQAGVRENHPHDIDITKEAPNYRTQ